MNKCLCGCGRTVVIKKCLCGCGKDVKNGKEYSWGCKRFGEPGVYEKHKLAREKGNRMRIIRGLSSYSTQVVNKKWGITWASNPELYNLLKVYENTLCLTRRVLNGKNRDNIQ